MYSYIFTEGPEDSIKGWRLFPIFIPVQQRLRGVKGPTQEWNNQFKEKIKNPIPYIHPYAKESSKYLFRWTTIEERHNNSRVYIIPTSIHYSHIYPLFPEAFDAQEPPDLTILGLATGAGGTMEGGARGPGNEMDTDRSIWCWHL